MLAVHESIIKRTVGALAMRAFGLLAGEVCLLVIPCSKRKFHGLLYAVNTKLSWFGGIVES